VAHVLIVDDKAGMRDMLARVFEERDHSTAVASSAEEALECLDERVADVVITDLKLPGLDGIALLDRVHERWPDLPVLVMTAYGTVSDAVEAMRKGAIDFVEKPFHVDVVEARVAHALEERRRRARHLALEEEWSRRFGRLVGSSPAMQEVYRMVERVAPGSSPVLVLGESGTGKELVAREIHDRSPRAEGPFVPINCAALPENLLESELFGHEKGAFTGADRARPGRLELADGGTVFLDEIGELEPHLQVKLLRFLQEKEVQRIGGTTTRRLDVRIVAATNRDLKAEVAGGRFREDFYYRLNVVGMTLPPLRRRSEDVLELADAFLARYARETHKGVELSGEVRAALLAHDWPGNVRELENAIERLVMLAGPNGIDVRDLPPEIRSGVVRREEEDGEAGPLALPDRLDAIERAEIARALRDHDGNQSRAARALGISRTTLQYKIDKHALSSGDDA